MPTSNTTTRISDSILGKVFPFLLFFFRCPFSFYTSFRFSAFLHWVFCQRREGKKYTCKRENNARKKVNVGIVVKILVQSHGWAKCLPLYGCVAGVSVLCQRMGAGLSWSSFSLLRFNVQVEFFVWLYFREGASFRLRDNIIGLLERKDGIYAQQEILLPNKRSKFWQLFHGNNSHTTKSQ